LIDDIFDAISYDKGSCVIFMLQQFLGGATFQRGLSAYLKKFAYRNAVTADLWASLEAASGQPVAAIMRDWCQHMGYPKVTVLPRDPSHPTTVTLQQSRYLADPSAALADADQVWTIPLRLGVTWAHAPSGARWSTTVAVLMPPSQAPWPVELRAACASQVDAPAWFNEYSATSVALLQANAGGSGLYVVSYRDAPWWMAVLDGVRQKTLSVIERIGVINDALAVAQVGEMKLAELMKVFQSFERETDDHVLTTLAGAVSTVHGVLGPADRDAFADLVAEFLALVWANVQEQVGAAKVPAALQATFVKTLLHLGHELTILDYGSLFDKHFRRDEPGLHVDLRYVVCVGGMLARGASAFEHVLARCERLATDGGAGAESETRALLLESLGAVEEPALLERALVFAVDLGKVTRAILFIYIYIYIF
jgi:aminopeptidase N